MRPPPLRPPPKLDGLLTEERLTELLERLVLDRDTLGLLAEEPVVNPLPEERRTVELFTPVGGCTLR